MAGDAQETVTLDGFLASLGGAVHSSGAFTISEQSAREKMARYTLVHPSLYLLELVAAAVLGGATRFEVSTRQGDTHFRFDGIPLTEEDCRTASGYLFEGSSSPRLGCLGLALSAAHSVAGGPLTLVLEAGTLLFDNHFRLVTEPLGMPGWTEIRVPGRFGFLGGLFRKDASLRQTLQLCVHAPLNLTLDGEDLSDGWKPDRYWGVAALLRWENPRYPLKWTGGTVNPLLVLPSPGDFSALMAVVPPESQVRGVTIIHQGVAYRSQDPDLAIPGLCIAVMTNGLERNLSRSEIVWDAEYRRLSQTLCEGAEELLRHVLTTPYRLTDRLRRCRASFEWADAHLPDESPQKPDMRSWLETEELSRAPLTFPTSISSLAARSRAQGPSRKTDDLNLLALETVIEKFRQPGNRRYLNHHLQDWTPTLAELLPHLEESPREKDLEAFLALLQPLHLGPSPTIEQQILRYRILGQPEKAMDLLEAWQGPPSQYGFHIEAELQVALQRPALALKSLLEQVVEPSLDSLLGKPCPSYWLRYLDFIADVLEYMDHPRALAARRLALESETNKDLLVPAHLELARQYGAKGRFLDSVHHRVKATHLALWSKREVPVAAGELPAMWKELESKSGVPTDLDRYLLPLCDKIGGTNPYLIARLAHRLRLKGELIKADQLLARAYTLARMDLELYGL